MMGKSLKKVVSKRAWLWVAPEVVDRDSTYLVTNAASRMASHTLLNGTSLVKVCPVQRQRFLVVIQTMLTM
jgi:hypothetical protein